jgi:lipopolysaccharide transport system ATP-binding protein
MSKPIIIDKVSKKFSKNLKKSMLYGMTDIMLNTFGINAPSDRLRKEEFWAVDDVSFDVEKGETLGLIGVNGSGKSTLLKMLNGIYYPDKGKITINGRVGALIEVGAGFHAMLTGRENIYVNGAILGMSKQEINKKFDSILDFADIGDFIDMPVKFYSSGMFVRLGFAIAVHVEPEILLVDEVLSVGDANFRRKCINKMAELRKQGLTMILVSHDTQTVQSISNRVVVIHKGKMQFVGDPMEACHIYELNTSKDNVGEDFSLTNKNHLPIVMSYPGFSSKEVSIDEIYLTDMNDDKKIVYNYDEEVTINVPYKTESIVKNPVIKISFINSSGIVCMGSVIKFQNIKDIEVLPNEGIIKIKYPKMQLNTDKYKISFSIWDSFHQANYFSAHFGWFSTKADWPAVISGVNTPVCYAPYSIRLDG